MKALLSALVLCQALSAAPSFADYDPKPLINEFQAAGITLVADPANLHSMPPAQFRTLLEAFWPALEQNKTRFLNNKTWYRTIYLNDVTIFSSAVRVLSLDVRMNSNELVGYVATNSRRISLESNLKLRFDMGLEFFPAGTGNRLGRFLQIVNTIQAKSAQLQRLTPLIKAVGFSDRNGFIPGSGWSLVIDENNFDTSLDAWVEGLSPMAQFAAFAETKKLIIRDDPFDGQTYYWEFTEAGRQLLAQQGQINSVIGNPFSVLAFTMEANSVWRPKYKQLSLSLKKENVNNLQNFIPAFVAALTIGRNMHLDINSEDGLTDPEFIACSKRLQRFNLQLQHRRYAITVFQFGKASRWDARTGTFVLGAETSDDAFNAVLRMIPPR